MIKFKVEFEKKALKNFKKLDFAVQNQILLWLNKNIQGTTNPRWTGKALSADKIGLWRYRIGKYRLIVEIHDGKAIVLVIRSGKRENIYE